MHGPNHLDFGQHVDQALVLGLPRRRFHLLLALFGVLAGLFQRGQHLFQCGYDLLFDGLGYLAHFGPGQTLGNLVHVVANLPHRLGEDKGTAVVVQQGESLVGFEHDLRFLAAKTAGLDFLVVS